MSFDVEKFDKADFNSSLHLFLFKSKYATIEIFLGGGGGGGLNQLYIKI